MDGKIRQTLKTMFYPIFAMIIIISIRQRREQFEGFLVLHLEVPLPAALASSWSGQPLESWGHLAFAGQL